MLHTELVDLANEWFRSKYGYFHSSIELKTKNEIVDLLLWDGKTSIMVEAKTTNNSFHQDKYKKTRIDPLLGVGEYRFYISPYNEIKIKNVPDGWGLLWVKNGSVHEVISFDTEEKKVKKFEISALLERDAMFYAYYHKRFDSHIRLVKKIKGLKKDINDKDSNISRIKKRLSSILDTLKGY